MPPKYHVQFTILFLLFLSITSCFNIVCSETLNRDTDFNRWISWHIENYKKKSLNLKKSESISQELSSTADWRLRMAEINRMEISVSQDGSGDFMTISEAVNSIPLFNTRRILVHINSGVYRYVRNERYII